MKLEEVKVYIRLARPNLLAVRQGKLVPAGVLPRTQSCFLIGERASNIDAGGVTANGDATNWEFCWKAVVHIDTFVVKFDDPFEGKRSGSFSRDGDAVNELARPLRAHPAYG